MWLFVYNRGQYSALYFSAQEKSMSNQIPEKLRTFINMAFDGKAASLATALHIDRTLVYRWLDGREIRSSVLGALLKLGLSIDWLLDEDSVGTTGMFADNEKGRKLRMRYFEADEPGSSPPRKGE